MSSSFSLFHHAAVNGYVRHDNQSEHDDEWIGNDRGLYNRCRSYKTPSLYFSNGQLVVADIGFQVSCPNIVYPMKCHQARN